MSYAGYMHRLVLERGYRKKGGMSGRHIAIHTWLEALGLHSYLPLFNNYGGVEDLLYASEAEIRDLGLKHSAHRAKIVSSLRILREKYEKGKSTGSGVFSLQQPRSPTSPTGSPSFPDFPQAIASPEKLEQDLQRELNADPSELKSRAWYHGSVTRQRAESVVTRSGDFLVRDSISKPGDFVLTCCWRGVPLHFMVNALVGDCAPGSLPTISYQFEEDSFGSIQELIQFYLSRQKPVTQASGAVLKNPVSRSMPLSYYDSKYGSQHSLDSGGYYTPSQSPKPSPFATPNSSPKVSPIMNRRGPKRTGSQPLLSVDDSDVDRSRSPSLERFGSLPVINIIPPGSPGYVSGFPRPQGESKQRSAPVVSHQRAGSAPLLMNDVNHNGLSYSHSTRMVPAGSESNLSRAPPPKPCRIPSIKYKKKPVVVVRNQELYEDDGRDYTDPDQLTGPPSWAENLHQRVGQDNNSYSSPFPLYAPTVAKSQSFQGNKMEGENIYDNNFNLNKGYQTLPTKTKTAKQPPRPRLSSDTKYPLIESGGKDSRSFLDNDRTDDADCKTGRRITMPGFNLGSRINLDAFTTTLFPSTENRLLEPSAVMKMKSLLLSSNARAIAGHLTKVDLEVARVAQEDDFGVRVTSGIELCTLPQGDQLRKDIIERCECQRLFVMTSLMTCNSVTERSTMLSQWIQTAAELRVSMGNLYAFTSIMEALSSPQVKRLRDTWLILRQKHTTSAYMFDTKLKALLKALNEGSGILPLQNVTLPNLTPVVQLLQRDLDEVDSLLSWEESDPISGLDFLLSHLDIARIVASQTKMYRQAALGVLKEVKVDGELEDVCRTEFQMKLMWGSKGARASRGERWKKFDQLLEVLSERLEPPGDDGTAV
ncbi:breast cancer anti-estrogen resistance protein 3 homolog isoform X2 [Littorina saxatilis]|uniref:breast cancer anti-estrogen resistance protein 3 homolog isoform X2 n=1 Tax=Littorina saxatilis TaxID=31220 RepID=UPI0038B43495